MNKLLTKNNIVLIVGVAFLIFMIIAFRSVGYAHPDEHFQLLEFVYLKLNPTTTGNIPWEYYAKIRPWLQPAFYYLNYQFFQNLGISSPFTMATIFRLESSVITFGAITLFLYSLRKVVRNLKVVQLSGMLIFFIWIVPHLAARTSSENMSMAMLLYGLSAYFLSIRNNSFDLAVLNQKLTHKFSLIFMTGVCLGLSYQCRFQMALACIPFGLWALVNASEKWRFIFALGTGFGVIFAAGFFVDAWGYGEWVWPAYRYVFENIVQGKAAEFGISPWYYYLPHLADQMNLVLGIPFVLLLVFSFFKLHTHLMVWIVGFFLLVHSCIGHKEDRFLLPMFPLCCVLVAHVIVLFSEKMSQKVLKIVGKTALIIFILVNLGQILHLCFKPKYKRISALQFLQEKVPAPYYVGENNDLQLEDRLSLNFYLNDRKKFVRLNAPGEILNFLKSSNEPIYLYLSGRGLGLIAPCYKDHCTLAYTDSILPDSLFFKPQSNFVRGLFRREYTHLFLRCRL